MKDEQGFDPSLTYTREDNESFDGTDAAHPAWYRGNDEATAACSKILLQELGIKIPEGAGVARLWHLAIASVRKLSNEREKLHDATLSYESMTCMIDVDGIPGEAAIELEEAESSMDEFRSIGKDD